MVVVHTDKPNTADDITPPRNHANQHNYIVGNQSQLANEETLGFSSKFSNKKLVAAGVFPAIPGPGPRCRMPGCPVGEWNLASLNDSVGPVLTFPVRFGCVAHRFVNAPRAHARTTTRTQPQTCSLFALKKGVIQFSKETILKKKYDKFISFELKNR